MKITLLLCAMILLGLGVNAQKLTDADIPVAVKNKFSSMYPTIKVVNWEKENDNYKAEFKYNSKQTTVVIEASGYYLQTETEISVSDLPVKVTDYLKRNVDGKTISMAIKIENAPGDINYKTNIEDEVYLFDRFGDFLSKEKAEK